VGLSVQSTHNCINDAQRRVVTSSGVMSTHNYRNDAQRRAVMTPSSGFNDRAKAPIESRVSVVHSALSATGKKITLEVVKMVVWWWW
jgi:hypothetical protein